MGAQVKSAMLKQEELKNIFEARTKVDKRADLLKKLKKILGVAEKGAISLLQDGAKVEPGHFTAAVETPNVDSSPSWKDVAMALLAKHHGGQVPDFLTRKFIDAATLTETSPDMTERELGRCTERKTLIEEATAKVAEMYPPRPGTAKLVISEPKE